MGPGVILFLVLAHCLVDHSAGERLEPPSTAVYTYKKSGELTAEKVEFNKTEKYILKEAILVLECNASYPIEWIAHYTKLSGDDRKITTDKGSYSQNLILARYVYELSENRRYAERVEDLESYQFTAVLEVHYWTDSALKPEYFLHTPTHFTCKATQTNDGELQSHVYMTVYDENENPQLFSLDWTNEYKKAYLEPTSLVKSTPKLDDKNGKCGSGSITVSPAQGTGNTCLKCDGDEMYLHTEACYTATECKCLAAREVEAMECLRKTNETSPNCFVPGTWHGGKEIHGPSLIFCTGAPMNRFVERAKVVQLAFSGVAPGNSRDKLGVSRPIYLNWEDADKTKMLYIHPIGKEKVIVGEEVTVKCEYSRFYFSHGSWFAIQHPDERIEYIRALEKKPCDRKRFSYEDVRETVGGDKLVECDWNVPEERRSTFTATLQRKFEAVGDYEIFCIGPIWNTTNWVDVSLPITVVDHPSVEKVTVTTTVLNAANGSLPEGRAAN